ncbi:response regulator [Palleronia abyssalis]|uniref:Putative transcriptional regulatory protein pdtaR n=1 Tax=Palleronia abyssalis TaxID=1501240 RepID=A0A2R8BXH2_9RHOB|nr:response regulator [Palleronia abyssalis]SPJ24855.1 putative transcriptional regulatory protein pdtaR [Palleronia abyssalis]
MVSAQGDSRADDTRNTSRPTRVLVVEDEALIGMDLVMTLESWGYVADGPHKNCDQAISALTSFEPDIGILDVNLGRDKTSRPIATEMSRLEIPYLFLTGYSASQTAEDDVLRHAPLLGKPVNHMELRRALLDLVPDRSD